MRNWRLGTWAKENESGWMRLRLWMKLPNFIGSTVLDHGRVRVKPCQLVADEEYQ